MSHGTSRRRLVACSLGILALAALGACRRAGEAAPPDGRTAVPLDAAQKAAVLAEMRTMLGSIDGVLAAALKGDTAAIRAAARRSGSAAAADPALESILPPPWLELAERTHGGFDSLAGAASAVRPREAVMAGLTAITPACVQCHATYRLP